MQEHDKSSIKTSRTQRTQDEIGIRHVYLDIGANYGNTLRLYRDIDKSRGPWDVYSFELSPSFAWYVDGLCNFLNGDGPKPILTTLPIGYTQDAIRYAKRYGCHNHVRPDGCLARRFCKRCKTMPYNKSLSKPETIDARLARATKSPKNRDRFTFLNAAVGRPHTFYFGTENSNCTTKAFCAGLPMVKPETPGAIAVQTVDVPMWLAKHFREEDHVVIKCDAEGGEYGFLEGMLKLKVATLIDTLAIECHPTASEQRTWHKHFAYCKNLIRRAREMNPKMQVLFERRGYVGWDSAFDPNVFYPTDPRTDES